MDLSKPRLQVFKSASYKRTITVLGIILLILAIPVTVALSTRQQTFRQDASGKEPLPVNLLISVDKNRAEKITTELKNYIQPNDIFWIGVGGRSMKNVNETAQIINATFPNNKIFTSTSIKNLERVSMEISDDVETVFLDYEQSNYSDWTWDFNTAKNNIESASEIVRTNGKKFGIIPTGSALFQKKLQKYNWNYKELASTADYQVIQTQGFCRRSLDNFRTAIKKLADQYAGQTQNLAVEIAIGDTPNSVTVDRAYQCSKIAYEEGIPNIFLFDSEQIGSFLKTVRDENVGIPDVPVPTPTDKPAGEPIPTPTSIPQVTTPPTILYPDEGGTYSGELSIFVSSSNQSLVKRVEFYIDGGIYGTIIESPFRYDLSTTRLTNGNHLVYGKVYYQGGQTVNTQTVSLSISN